MVVCLSLMESWLTLCDLVLSGKKLWVDLVRSFGSKLFGSHGGESFAVVSRHLWNWRSWPWWMVSMRLSCVSSCLLCVIFIEFVWLSESKFACFNPTDVLENWNHEKNWKCHESLQSMCGKQNDRWKADDFVLAYRQHKGKSRKSESGVPGCNPDWLWPMATSWACMAGDGRHIVRPKNKEARQPSRRSCVVVLLCQLLYVIALADTRWVMQTKAVPVDPTT